MEDRIEEIPLDQIDDPAVSMRSAIRDEELEDLMRSMRDEGQIEPIVIRPKNERYELLAGARRRRAAQLLGWATIKSIIREVSDDEALMIRWSENIHRLDVNPVDEAMFLDQMRNSTGLSIKELASRIHKSETYIRDRLAMKFWDEQLLGAVQNKQIEFSAAKWLAKIGDPLVRKDYLRFAVQGGLTSYQAQVWYNNWKRDTLPEHPTEETIKDLETGREKVVRTVPCEICGGDIPLEKARLFYAHKECVEKIRNL